MILEHNSTAIPLYTLIEMAQLNNRIPQNILLPDG